MHLVKSIVIALHKIKKKKISENGNFHAKPVLKNCFLFFYFVIIWKWIKTGVSLLFPIQGII